MAYELAAIIGTESTIDAVIQDLGEARCVPLAQGVAMIPLTDGLFEELRQAHEAGDAPHEQQDGDFDWEEQHSRNDAAVAGWARTASRHGVLAYCSAGYSGGVGAQGVVIWKDGEEIERSDSVNRALRLLGVTCDDGDYEWDTVGLGRFRQTDGWLALARS